MVALARQIGLGADTTLKARVAGAIERVLEMQDSSGAFGVWGPSNGDLWLTSYVTDFLLRAKENGHAVNAKALSLALDKLANSVAHVSRALFASFDSSGGASIVANQYTSSRAIAPNPKRQPALQYSAPEWLSASGNASCATPRTAVCPE